jgi:hypothetical protein
MRSKLVSRTGILTLVGSASRCGIDMPNAPPMLFRRSRSVIRWYHLPSELLLFILGAVSEDFSLLLLLLLGDLVALMILFSDLAMLLFENPISLLFGRRR